jgi:hypothetical protein
VVRRAVPRCSGIQGAVEMKRISIVGLFLAAVFALSAIAASSASATPGLLLARVPGGGSIVGVTFLSLGLLALLTTDGPGLRLIDCTHVRNTGLFLSSTLGDLLILFSSCSTAGLKCNTEGSSEGQIHLPLATTLFHFGLAHLTLATGRIPAVAILLTKHVKLICGGGAATVLILGSVIGALRLDQGSHGPIPLNTPLSTALLSFEQTAHGLQHLRLFLFEDELRTYDLHSITTDIIKGEGPVELSAEVASALLDLFRLSNGTHVEIELFEHLT